jgi:hypothetical protein
LRTKRGRRERGIACNYPRSYCTLGLTHPSLPSSLPPSFPRFPSSRASWTCTPSWPSRSSSRGRAWAVVSRRSLPSSPVRSSCPSRREETRRRRRWKKHRRQRGRPRPRSLRRSKEGEEGREEGVLGIHLYMCDEGGREGGREGGDERMGAVFCVVENTTKTTTTTTTTKERKKQTEGRREKDTHTHPRRGRAS